MNITKTEEEILNIKPLADNILVRIKEVEDKTRGGIYLPTGMVDQMSVISEGEVIAVGPGAYTYTGEVIPPCVSPGDKILFSPYGELNIDSPPDVKGQHTYKIIPEKCIKAII
jgi:chaperonin GroES